MAGSAEKAYQAIRSRILDGTYVPGQRLREEALATALGVSRTPVREALRRLHGDQFVRIEPNSGVRVTEWTDVDLRDIFALRSFVEAHAASLAARHATLEQVEELSVCAANMLDVANSDTVDARDVISDLNTRFHDLVTIAAGSEKLQTMLASVRTISLVDSTFRRYSTAQLDRSLRHHVEIADAIGAGDDQWARSVMSSHVLAARHAMLGGGPRYGDG